MIIKETCVDYFRRHLKQGWKVAKYDYPFAIIRKGKQRKEIDLRNDVLYLLPNSDGAYTECSIYPTSPSTHYDKVDDPIDSPDETYTYVFAPAGTTKRDTYGLPYTSQTGSISSITIYFRVTGTSGTAQPLIYFISLGYLWEGTGVPTPSDEWSTLSQTLEKNPYTGNDWTWDDINSIQIGIKLIAAGKKFTASCTQIYLAVNYTPPAPPAVAFMKPVKYW